MAIMCPIKDEDSFAPNSNEKMMYELLQKLDDNYYIFHSLRMLNVDAGLVEREVDFVVFNQAHGILFIEAKNTRPILKDQTWFYENGRRMNYGSPYVQASTAMYNFLDILKNKYGEKGKEIKRNCKMIYCVWLPLVSSSELNWKKMPLNASREITITKDDHENLQDRIEEIMSQPLYNYLGYSLNDIKYINTHKENTYIGISLPKEIYNEETKQYSLFIRITTDFSEEESYFIFQAFFEIND